MGGNGQQPGPELGWLLTIALVGAVAVVALRCFYGGGTEWDRTRLWVVGPQGRSWWGEPVGAIAPLLTVSRQRSTGLTLEHQRKVAPATERDAAEQRITATRSGRPWL
ncbi:MAG: hypothetical protein ACRDQ4_18665 [Pseudonocardiaceae bacterium]